MRRREFIAGVAGTTVLPVAARAQPATLPIVGVLHPGSPAIGPLAGTDPLVEGLNDAGYADGRNVRLEVHWLDGQYNHQADILDDMVRRKVAAIFCVGIATTRAAKAQTATIPIVFSMGEDPVKEGIVASFSRPGGNITGYANFMNLLGSKRLTLLRSTVPDADTFGILVNPKNPNAEPDAKDWQTATKALGRQLRVFNASTETEVAAAFAEMANLRVGALFVNTDPLFIAWSEQIVAQAARYRMPTMYDRRDFPAIGGLMSYGASETDTIRRAGIYVGRILRGEKPADLPVQQSIRFAFVVNLRTARAIDFKVPEPLLALADEVIE
jgi:putative ABC transport system substrate-binding protein